MNAHELQRLQQRLQAVVDDVDSAIERAAHPASNPDEDIRNRLEQRLHDARHSLLAFEQRAAGGLRRARHSAKSYAIEHPWIIAGGLVALMLVSGVLSRSRT